MSSNVSASELPVAWRWVARACAVIVAVVSMVAAAGSAYYAYLSADASERSAKTAEAFRLQSIQERLFDFEADNNWNLAIKQVAGPKYPIRQITLTPTFQDVDGNTVTGESIPINLEPHRLMQSEPTYQLPTIEAKICRFQGAVKFYGSCTQARLLFVDAQYSVFDDKRSIRIHRGQ